MSESFTLAAAVSTKRLVNKVWCKCCLLISTTHLPGDVAMRHRPALSDKTTKLYLSLVFLPIIALATTAPAQTASLIGKEISVPVHLQDGQERETSIPALIAFGEKLFSARWTSQEGQGRPLTKGTGSPISDPTSPLVFPRNFDRLSGPIRTPARAATTHRSSAAAVTA
jgi:hypothetical protein